MVLARVPAQFLHTLLHQFVGEGKGAVETKQTLNLPKSFWRIFLSTYRLTKIPITVPERNPPVVTTFRGTPSAPPMSPIRTPTAKLIPMPSNIERQNHAHQTLAASPYVGSRKLIPGPVGLEGVQIAYEPQSQSRTPGARETARPAEIRAGVHGGIRR